MDIFTVQDDGSEQLLASGLDPGEVGELEEWWRYTKPFGPGIKIVVRLDLLTVAALSTSGTEPGPGLQARYTEKYVG